MYQLARRGDIRHHRGVQPGPTVPVRPSSANDSSQGSAPSDGNTGANTAPGPSRTAGAPGTSRACDSVASTNSSSGLNFVPSAVAMSQVWITVSRSWNPTTTATDRPLEFGLRGGTVGSAGPARGGVRPGVGQSVSGKRPMREGACRGVPVVHGVGETVVLADTVRQQGSEIPCRARRGPRQVPRTHVRDDGARDVKGASMQWSVIREGLHSPMVHPSTDTGPAADEWLPCEGGLESAGMWPPWSRDLCAR